VVTRPLVSIVKGTVLFCRFEEMPIDRFVESK
jgi:hypothetical protein